MIHDIESFTIQKAVTWSCAMILLLLVTAMHGASKSLLALTTEANSDKDPCMLKLVALIIPGVSGTAYCSIGMPVLASFAASALAASSCKAEMESYYI